MKNNNYIDTEFYNLMDFIKKHNLEELIDVIKHNFLYMLQKNPVQAKNIIDFYNEYKFWGTIDIKNNDFTLIHNNAKSLLENTNKYEWLYNKLADYRSKKTLTTILYYWLMFDYSNLPKIIENTYNQYFDLDIIKCGDNEIFVDIGAYIGDTMIDFVKTFGTNYKKIYCYEIVPKNIEYINQNRKKFNLKNIEVVKNGVSDKNGTLYIENDEVSSVTKLKSEGTIKVNTTTIDKDIKEKVTFIKMDIEGGEKEALLGSLKQIKKNKPKLAICTYHNNNHLTEIPEIIDNANKNYKFYLRYYGGPFLPTEYILYAV